MQNHADLISIGEMARACSVSVKTLRHYQDLGILEPVEVNQDSGYRYYSFSQCEVIDIVKQLQYLGFSLSEIAEMKQSEDSRTVLQMLENMQERLWQEKGSIESKLKNMDDVLQRLAEQERHLPFNVMHIRHFSATPLLRLGDFTQLREEDGMCTLDSWIENVLNMKRDLQRRQLPVEFITHFGSFVPQEALEDGNLRYEGGFIPCSLCNTSNNIDFERQVWWLPAGDYMTMYTSTRDYPSKGNIEFKQLETMLAHCADLGLKPSSAFVCETVSQTFMSRIDSESTVLRMRFRVSY